MATTIVTLLESKENEDWEKDDSWKHIVPNELSIKKQQKVRLWLRKKKGYVRRVW
jgi:hypothetical protein